jgi:2-iminoacetate synthase
MNTQEYPDFVDEAFLHAQAALPPADPARIADILAKAMAKEPLDVPETAVLLSVRDAASRERLFDAARQLKRDVYGHRIVLFAPLYIGNHCINDCVYCAFRRSLRTTVRQTLTPAELVAQVTALEDSGHKRLILVFGEHPDYTPEFIAATVRQTYAVRHGPGEIRRVNINAAPLDHAGYRVVKAAGIGTYQVFQETYHHETYRRVHPPQTHKGDYLWRLHALTRAFEAGCDDIGIGALFGLYDWRFEVLAMVSHAHFLSQRFGCGPHTISFPRIRPAHGVKLDPRYFTSDDDFKHLVAVLRLAVPYTGLILTAREPAAIRREVLAFGVSQIDAGTRVELAGYTKADQPNEPRREQFQIGDTRSLDAIMQELLRDGYLPSFCTSCYRQGRTGEHFMEYAIPGFIRNFCTPNAILTLAEYLEDYASLETRTLGWQRIEAEVAALAGTPGQALLTERLARVRQEHARDLYL